MPSFDRAFVMRYAYVWTVGLLLACAVALFWSRSKVNAPEFELGGVVSIIAIKSMHTGKYLEVSLDDGLIRATADTPTSINAQFRALVLGASTVKALRIGTSKVAHAAEKWSSIKMVRIE